MVELWGERIAQPARPKDTIRDGSRSAATGGVGGAAVPPAGACFLTGKLRRSRPALGRREKRLTL